MAPACRHRENPNRSMAILPSMASLTCQRDAEFLRRTPYVAGVPNVSSI